MGALVTQKMAIDHVHRLYPPGSILQVEANYLYSNYDNRGTTFSNNIRLVKGAHVICIRAENQSDDPWLTNLVLLHENEVFSIGVNALSVDESNAYKTLTIVSRAAPDKKKSHNRNYNNHGGISQHARPKRLHKSEI